MTYIPVHSMPKSLVWHGDRIADFTQGTSWNPDGSPGPSSPLYGEMFDRTLISPSGSHAIVYTERATKAVLLDVRSDDCRVVRELDRSFEYAEDFDYPIAFGTLPDGREVIVHCPSTAGELHVDEVESGCRLTAGVRKPEEIYHAAPAVSPDGRHLAVAGWVWHPLCVAHVFDLTAALADPALLDQEGFVADVTTAGDDEVTAACWLDADRIAFGLGRCTDDVDAGRFRGFGVWSLSAGGWLYRHALDEVLGRTLLASRGRIVSFYGHPRVHDAVTGRLIAEWPELPVEPKAYVCGVDQKPSPTVALHPDGTRLAVAQEDAIAIVHLPA
ncbi:hypothetical protein [Yinghuangia soli]|uniref:Uncharacterized protein n=1 Tax=Yinghuangia soli TaxID=2908204 RepID=A0AA41PY40_9ACTN|nr:hypothetical protein [Yinghuangia soli]MCF2527737.1 hypothetical protein [Yinghuangia soli]